MIEKSLYYAKSEFHNVVRAVGGEWNDKKKRPIICLIKSTENDNLYWAIPMGKLNHRDDQGKSRLNEYLNYPDKDIRSCYYHVGRTTNKSIFFISDAVPITDKYIDEEHVGANGEPYTLKNKLLTSELERKLKRILSEENSKKNKFRQHITDIKNYLIQELELEKLQQEAAQATEPLNLVET